MTIEQKIAKLMAESKKLQALEGTGSEDPEAAPTGVAEGEESDEAVESPIAEEEIAEEAAHVEEELKFDMTADVAALTEGEDLSEEFKQKAATIFEAAVVSRVKSEVTKLEEQYAEAFQVELEEAVSAEVEGLIEQVDGYLTYMAEQWMKDNEIALERGLKTEILEGFVSGLKGLFEEHYIDVPEGATDIVTEMESIVAEKELELEELANKLNESEQRNIELNKSISEKVRADLIEAKCSGLADTEAERFTILASELVFENAETFEKKLKIIRENYFDKKPAPVGGNTFLSEDENPVATDVTLPKNMEVYSRALASTI